MCLILSGGLCSNQEYDLVKLLLTNYSPNVRPVINISQPIKVKLTLALNQIVDMVNYNNTLFVIQLFV